MGESVCHQVPSSSRPFVLGDYIDGEPALPKAGPCRLDEGLGCRIRIHSWRGRKTGPLHDLAVLTCRTHGGFFTLYPPGFGPYLRKPVVRDGLDRPTKSMGKRVLDIFGGTLFEAALDAADGLAWERHRSAMGTTPDKWSTQCRQIDKAARILGLDDPLHDDARAEIADALHVDAVLVKGHAASHGFRAQGLAIREVLEAMVDGSSVNDRLCVSGSLAGLWGETFRCLPKTRRLRRLSFHRTGTRCRSPGRQAPSLQ